MVDAGEIFAEIDASAGMVRFLEDPEQYTSPGALQRLNHTIQASFTLAQKLQAVNNQVSCCHLAACVVMTVACTLLWGMSIDLHLCLSLSSAHHCSCPGKLLCCRDLLASVQVSLDPAYVSKLNAREKGDRFPEDPSDLDAEPQSLAYPFQDD